MASENPSPKRRRREPTPEECQARAERRAERMIRLAILRIGTRTALPRFRVAAIFGAIVAERE